MYETDPTKDHLIQKLSLFVLQTAETESEDIDQLLIQFDQNQDRKTEKTKWFSN